ncbi:ankyrin-like protein [Taterapox virus]|uniref:Ankyrin-like protein n=1 Tax=Taterapox virus TaxID=28871 RepID=Q0NNZ8_9POXV|nr:ankyrin-like protein [Taterapox virus]ABD97779.1 ankyrin-like protein [Taterapox virus]
MNSESESESESESDNISIKTEYENEYEYEYEFYDETQDQSTQLVGYDIKLKTNEDIYQGCTSINYFHRQ